MGSERPSAKSSNWIAKAGIAASLVIAVALAASIGAGASSLSARGEPAARDAISAVVSSVSRLPGVLAYVSDSDFYGSGGKETLATASPEGTRVRTLVSPADVGFGLLAFSPSGGRLAYFRDSSSGASVDVMDLASRRVVTVLRLRGAKAYVDGLAWTPSGRALVVGSNERPGSSTTHSGYALWRVPLTGGKPKGLTTYEDAGDPVVLPDGDLVYIVSKTYSSTSSLRSSAVWTSRPSGTDPHRLFTSRHFVYTPAVSPDGRTLVLSVVLTDTTMHLESFTLATRRHKNLTPLVKGRSDVSPSFSPDGTELVFLSSRAGRYATTKAHQLLDAYVMTATGKNPKKVIARRGDKWSMVLVAWGA